MLTIRLSRVGKKKQPSYRIVVQDKRRDPWSPAIDVVGHFDPRSKGEQIQLDEAKVKEWLGKGAQPSETIHNMFIEKKLLEGKKINKMHLSKKRRAAMVDSKAKEEEAKVAAEAKKKAAEEAKIAEAAAAKEAKAAEEAAATAAAAPAPEVVAEVPAEAPAEAAAEAPVEPAA